MITEFKNDFAFLSNFWMCSVPYNDRLYKSVEHGYQALKAIKQEDHDMIMFAKYPHQAKRFGNVITLREDWEQIKYEIMFDLVYSKFTYNLNLKEMLIFTEQEKLIEGNTWHDNFWGNCFCEKCKNNPGKNILGKILEDVRRNIC